MKTSITIFATAAMFFAACSSNPKNTEDTTSKVLSSLDTTGLAQFQQWKQQQEWRNQEIIETNGINEDASNGQANYAGSGPARNYSNSNTYSNNEPTVRRTPRTTRNTSTARKSTRTSRVGTGTSTGSTSAGQGTAQTTKKKGWSNAAKGTVIGAGSGAVLGAIVSKKKGKGAIIGGILGAGGGYVLGRMKDKKVGRY
jgi:hypothetical protein